MFNIMSSFLSTTGASCHACVQVWSNWTGTMDVVAHTVSAQHASVCVCAYKPYLAPSNPGRTNRTRGHLYTRTNSHIHSALYFCAEHAPHFAFTQKHKPHLYVSSFCGCVRPNSGYRSGAFFQRAGAWQQHALCRCQLRLLGRCR
jgi:hypothetical protein